MWYFERSYRSDFDALASGIGRRILVNYQLWLGIGAVISAGALQGVFAVPMKFASRWNYENIWFVYSLTGMVVFPWFLVIATVPHPAEIYASTSTTTLFGIAGFGVCWGIGATLTGVGLTLLGIGLGMAIILGLSASIGSLIPLVILNPQNLHTRQGHVFLLGTTIMLAGIALCARAGILRDAIRNGEVVRVSRNRFLTGFIVCCASGLLSSALNFSYAFGGAAIHHALDLGTGAIWSAGIVMALAVTGGFLANFLYCGYLLLKNRSARRFFAAGAGTNWFCGALMGFFWFGGQTLYSLGISRMGNLGVVVGWPLLMGMIIVTSNAASIATGEWNGVSTYGKRFLAVGMVTILTALGVLAVAS
jgi:L-rhamnose-H+ transport protein